MNKVLVVVGSNPSQSRSGRTLRNLEEWMGSIGYNYYGFTNVSLNITKGNKPLKKEDVDIQSVLRDTKGHIKIVALGNTASNVLKKLNLDHFKLPHPSPLNRQVNDKNSIKDKLLQCKRYIEDDLF